MQVPCPGRGRPFLLTSSLSSGRSRPPSATAPHTPLSEHGLSDLPFTLLGYGVRKARSCGPSHSVPCPGSIYPWPEGTAPFLVPEGAGGPADRSLGTDHQGVLLPQEHPQQPAAQRGAGAQNKGSAPSPVRGACLQPAASSELQRHAQSRVPSHPPNPVAQHPRSGDQTLSP